MEKTTIRNIGRLIVISHMLILIACMGVKSKKGISTELILLASDISKKDQQAGVIQVSPGADNSPAGNTSTNTPTNTSTSTSTSTTTAPATNTTSPTTTSPFGSFPAGTLSTSSSTTTTTNNPNPTTTTGNTTVTTNNPPTSSNPTIATSTSTTTTPVTNTTRPTNAPFSGFTTGSLSTSTSSSTETNTSSTTTQTTTNTTTSTSTQTNTQTSTGSTSGTGIVSGVVNSTVTIINGLFGGGGQTVAVPADKAILRTKLFDDPVLNAANKSYVNFIVGYDFIESLFYNPTFTGFEIPPAMQVLLEIEKVEVLTSTAPIVIYPTVKESKITIYREKHYFPFFTGLILPVGNYTGVKVYLKRAGKLRMQDREYSLVVETPVISFSDSFAIQAGKVTTLESMTLKDYNDGLAGNRRTPTRSKFEKNLSPEFEYQFNSTAVQHMYINIVNKAANTHDSLTKLLINVESLSVSTDGSSSFVLNRTPTQFEVLQLRNGYVGLAGANQIEAGNYEYFEFSLTRNHSAEITGGVSVPLYMDEASQNIFRFYGPFILKGGETFETYLHLDPNRSVYFTKDRGFVIDPTLSLLSTVSMNPNEEETKIISSAGKFMNVLASESDAVIRGTVTSVTPVIAANASGRKLIYSDVVIGVSKSLKGNIALAPFSFRVAGGTYNGVKLEVSTAPIFRNGEEVIVYLQKKKEGGYRVTRGELGKVKL